MELKKQRSALLYGLLSLLLTLCVSGCGDSENYVFTGSSVTPPAATTGSLTFNFQPAAAAQDIAPPGTTSLRFDFFRTNPPAESSFVFTENRTFSTVVLIEDVPSDVVSVLVTAFDTEGLPLATYSGTFAVQVGQNVVVDLADAVPVTLDSISVGPDPINLAYGLDIPFFTESPAEEDVELIGGEVQAVITGSFSNGSNAELPITASSTTFTGLPEQINVTTTGLFSTVSLNALGYSLPATATYTLGSVARSDEFTVNISALLVIPGTPGEFPQVTPTDPIIASPGGYDGGFVAALISPDATTTTVFVDSDLVFALETPVAGISIDPETGVITAASGIAPNTAVFVLVSYVDPNTSLSYTSRVEFRVDPDVN